jgi:hypothetical protein
VEVDRQKRRDGRIKRKRQLAAQQVDSFEDTLSGHELNLARLNAFPEDERDTDWQNQHAENQRAIEVLERAIETTLAEAQAQ